MITFSLSKCRICLTFGFFFILALTSLQDNSLGLLSLVFCVLHEFGHLAAMKIIGAAVSEIRFYGAGISISSSGISCLTKPKQAVIYLSGPFVNLLFAVLLKEDLSVLNLCLAVFNLLPIPYFDGGRLLSLIFGDKSLITKCLAVLSYGFLGAALVYAAASGAFAVSSSSLLTFIFIGLACVLDR